MGQSTANPLDEMQTSMREQSIETDDDSTDDLPADEDGRKGPRANRVKYETLVAMVEADRAAWLADPNASAEQSTIAHNILDKWLATFVAGRDAPREDRVNTGSHYVGQRKDGSRVHFQSTSVPAPKGYPSFVKVWGKYNSPIAADYDVKYETQLSRRTVAFDLTAK